MWIQQREWILQISKAESIMLDGKSICIIWKSDKEPDRLEFKDDGESADVYDQIVESIKKKSIVIDLPG